ncbi:MAG: thioredoxin-dependent thiol peroxidase [Sphingobacteriales bacterium]|nr:MAG: thioredoxin-dependent thiol peroxidase [Sphingobacteriales bacterium]
MLEPGQKAPLFKGKNQMGAAVSLKDYLGKKLAIFFYPEDDTPTCTEQACNLRDNYALLKKEGIEVVGISPDDVKSHEQFIGKFELPYTLVADPQKKIIEAYGVWGEKNMYGRKYMGLIRTTFLVDEKGVIKHIFKKPRVRQHGEEIIAKAKL